MADRTTTLKTQTGDNVYPNVIEANLPKTVATYQGVQDFVDMEMSTEIYNHTADSETIVRANEGTKGSDHVKFSLANTLNNKITNSLQKPTGLTKTELVGVGTNGQENIEIGDNLTLVNGKLSASASGGGGEDFDEITFSNDWSSVTGTITGSKPVLINKGEGKELLNQLITDSICSFFYIDITDNDITISQILTQKGEETPYKLDYKIMNKIYSHFITLTSSSLGSVNFNFYNTSEDALTIATLKTALSGKSASCSGFIDDGGTKESAMYIAGEQGGLNVGWYDPSDGSTGSTTIDNTFSISDLVSAVE